LTLFRNLLMKLMRVFPGSLLFLVSAVSVSAQSFINLNFESANVSNPDIYHSVPFTNAFPGWQAYKTEFGYVSGGGPVNRGYYNAADLDQVTIGIYDTNANPFYAHPVFGNYTAYIEADLGSMTACSLDLYQTGLVPTDAQSVRFRTTSYSSLNGVSAQFTLYMNGFPIPFAPITVQSNSVGWAADISPYANTLSELRFRFSASYPASPTHVFFAVGLDNINFTSLPAPEPSSTLQLCLGLLWLLVRARRSARPCESEAP
jgi:hypothetical protein